MTDPEQVSVNVADLVAVLVDDDIDTRSYYEARGRLKGAIPVPEWEPTDDMRAKYRRVFGSQLGNTTVDVYLRALHREGLIP